MNDYEYNPENNCLWVWTSGIGYVTECGCVSQKHESECSNYDCGKSTYCCDEWEANKIKEQLK